MQPTRKLFRSALALILALAAVPSWACLRSCNTGSQSLECLRLCSRSHALLTQNGELASMSSQDCGVSLEQAPAVLSVSAFQLEAPAVVTLATDPALSLALSPAMALDRHLRGPPSLSSSLWTQSPPANAPPSFC